MAKLIELRDVYKIYSEGLESEVRALDGVSLDIEKGEFVAVVVDTQPDPDGILPAACDGNHPYCSCISGDHKAFSHILSEKYKAVLRMHCRYSGNLCRLLCDRICDNSKRIL